MPDVRVGGLTVALLVGVVSRGASSSNLSKRLILLAVEVCDMLAGPT